MEEATRHSMLSDFGLSRTELYALQAEAYLKSALAFKQRSAAAGEQGNLAIPEAPCTPSVSLHACP